MSKINVAHIRDSSGIFGAERVILTLHKNIDRSRFNFSLICMRRRDGRSERLIATAKRSDLTVFPVDVKGRFDISALREIRQILGEHSVSIVHSHDFKSDLYSLLASHHLKISRVATAHGSTRDSLLKKVYLFCDERILYGFLDRIIAVSEDVRNLLVRARVPSEKIAVIQNGLDSDLLMSEPDCKGTRQPLPTSKENTVFAVIGRLYPDKGHRFFLQAFSNVQKRNPQIQALFVGEGPFREQIEKQIRELGLEDRVFLCGERSDMKWVYEHIDYIVIPSLREGLPYVLLEAMGSGIPVVATSVGDIPLLIDDAESGYLVPPGNIEMLCQRMEDLLNRHEEAALMAKKAKDVVREKFSAERMARHTEEVYQALVN